MKHEDGGYSSAETESTSVSDKIGVLGEGSLAVLGVLLLAYGSLSTVHAVLHSSLFVMALGLGLVLCFSPAVYRRQLMASLPGQVLR